MATKAMQAMQTMSATALKATRSTSTMKAMKAMKAITHVKVPAFLGAGRLKKLKPKADLKFHQQQTCRIASSKNEIHVSHCKCTSLFLNTNTNL